jgi:DNA primase
VKKSGAITKRVPRCRESGFRRKRLPTSINYFTSEGIKLFGRGAWRSAICPFHADKKPSLRIRVETGGFCCMACGAHGGDVLDFHRLRYGLSFVEAAQALGAWEA